MTASTKTLTTKTPATPEARCCPGRDRLAQGGPRNGERTVWSKKRFQQEEEGARRRDLHRIGASTRRSRRRSSPGGQGGTPRTSSGAGGHGRACQPQGPDRPDRRGRTRRRALCGQGQGAVRIRRHHVKEEQNEMFPKAKATSLDLAELGVQMAARKTELLAARG